MTPDDLARERPFLFGLAYRMLGSAADADDVLQEAWLRVRQVDDARSPRALLATVVTRLCLDETRSARRRREEYVGEWLPEPVADAPGGVALGAAESVSMAFLVLLESLSPLERAVFLLREVFDFDFDEVAAAVGRSEAACRQLLHRAKAHLDERPARYAPDPTTRDALTVAFVTAVATGDVASLVAMLSEQVRAVTDHGGKASAARRPVTGANSVARFLTGLQRKAAGAVGVDAGLEVINGAPALVVREGGAITTVMQLGWEAGEGGPRVAAVYMTRNPDKLRRLEAALRGR
jgi:RNA polymerase sigma-70 factor (ECF subfamily)